MKYNWLNRRRNAEKSVTLLEVEMMRKWFPN